MKLLQLGRTLMSTPELVLLDEPTAGVNPRLSQEIFGLIDMLRKEKGLSFFIVEHKLDLLFDFVDLVYVMHQGKIITKGLPDEILSNRACVDAYLGDYKCPS
jgi:branched-chain amino acid transport system ATP-binding protein